MDDSLAVRVRHRLCHCDDVWKQRESFLERGSLLNQVRKSVTRNHLHHVVRSSIWPMTKIVNWNDRWVLQTRGDESLAHEARLSALLEEFFESHRAIQALVNRLKNPPQSSPRVLRNNSVASGVLGAPCRQIHCSARLRPSDLVSRFFFPRGCSVGNLNRGRVSAVPP